MFNRGWRQHIEDRQTSLETSVNELRSDVGNVVAAIADQGSKLDKLVSGLADTGERAAQRAQTVKVEMRDEAERRGKEKGDLLKNGLSLAGFVALVVGAFCGPYLNKINSTAEGQSADTVAIAAVREVLAQQGAGIGRNQAALDAMREYNSRRDAELREHDQDLAFMKGVAATEGQPRP